MRKTIFLALKDLRITFRDRAAVLIMFALPLSLTLTSYFAFGGSSDPTPEAIPVVIVNEDKGSLGGELVGVFQSVDLADLVLPQVLSSKTDARQAVDNDMAAAAVLIPADFSESLFSHAFSQESSRLVIVMNPTQTISATVIHSIAGRFIEIVNTTSVATSATFAQLLRTGRITSDEISTMAPEIGTQLGDDLAQNPLISVERIEPEPVEKTVFRFDSFNYLEYYAASMAVLGLMFSMTASSRSLLAEREAGTLARYRTTPSSNSALVAGKILSTLLTGCMQMGVLILITTLFLGADWGSTGPLAVFTIALVAAISAMGMLIAGFARSHAQAGMLGTVVTLILGAASGNFLPRQAFPEWLQTLSRIGPSAWGIEGYQALANGAGFTDLHTHILALAGLTILFSLLALLGLRRHL
jgi:ABC-2 type transport system permease protein